MKEYWHNVYESNDWGIIKKVGRLKYKVYAVNIYMERGG